MFVINVTTTGTTSSDSGSSSITSATIWLLRARSCISGICFAFISHGHVCWHTISVILQPCRRKLFFCACIWITLPLDIYCHLDTSMRGKLLRKWKYSFPPLIVVVRPRPHIATTTWLVSFIFPPLPYNPSSFTYTWVVPNILKLICENQISLFQGYDA